MFNLFLRTVESSFDHTAEVFMTKLEKFLLNVQKRSSKQFYSQKKIYFLRRGSSGRGEMFLTKLESFSLNVGKHEQNISFFKKKLFLVKNFLWTCTMQFWQPRQKTSTKSQKTCAQCPKTIRNNIKFSILGKFADWTVPMDT